MANAKTSYSRASRIERGWLFSTGAAEAASFIEGDSHSVVSQQK
jgi:hypothetical protein